MTERRLRIGIVAGEASGDILGAGLIQALRNNYPNIEFVGIGGPKMIAEGFISLVPMEKLSVMGIVEVLKHLRSLLSIRSGIVKHFIQSPPDIFIGIDSPDFCIPVERKLKQAGIKTIHYVSPSVWAWRQKRVFKIKKSIDHILCLLPFEKAFYDKFQVPATFVGHTLADEIELEPDHSGARAELNISEEDEIITLMPGSRRSEISRIGPLFFEAAVKIQSQRPSVRFLLPTVNQSCFDLVSDMAKGYDQLNLSIKMGDSRTLMLAADAILLASGTAALEAMLLKKPMVVSYKLAPLTWWLVQKLIQVKWASLPNLLANKEIVPEYLQHEATPANLANAMLKKLDHQQNQQTIDEFVELHLQLRQSADQKAADVILKQVF